jgi:hypothetical protein
VKQFIVIGYWSDTQQRFAKGVYARSGNEAEQDVLAHSENDSGALRICAVIMLDEPGFKIRLADKPDQRIWNFQRSSIGDRSCRVGKMPPIARRAKA